jgi:dUTPase
MQIKIIKFNDDYKKPFRAHYNDAGADVFISEHLTIESGATVKVPLGLSIVTFNVKGEVCVPGIFQN